MGKRKTPPAIPQLADLVDLLEKHAVAYRDGRELSQAPSDLLESVRKAVALEDWGRALIKAFDLGEWCHGANATPVVLTLMQNTVDLAPFESKARRQEDARQAKIREKKVPKYAKAKAAVVALRANKPGAKPPELKRAIVKIIGGSLKQAGRYLDEIDAEK
jgi:hypothetical protein